MLHLLPLIVVGIVVLLLGLGVVLLLMRPEKIDNYNMRKVVATEHYTLPKSSGILLTLSRNAHTMSVFCCVFAES